MKKTLLLLTTLVLIFSCNQQKTGTKAEGEKVMQASRDWSRIASSGDVVKNTQLLG